MSRSSGPKFHRKQDESCLLSLNGSWVPGLPPVAQMVLWLKRCGKSCLSVLRLSLGFYAFILAGSMT